MYHLQSTASVVPARPSLVIWADSTKPSGPLSSKSQTVVGSLKQCCLIFLLLLHFTVFLLLTWQSWQHSKIFKLRIYKQNTDHAKAYINLEILHATFKFMSNYPFCIIIQIYAKGNHMIAQEEFMENSNATFTPGMRLTFKSKPSWTRV